MPSHYKRLNIIPGVVGDGSRLTGSRRGWHIFGLVASIAVGVVFALAGLGGVIGASGSTAQRVRAGQTFGGDVALAVVSALIAAACVAAAVHFEHQLRRHEPAAQGWSSTAPPWTPLGRPRRGRRYAPWAMAFELLLFTGLFVGLVIGSVVTRSEGQRSARVQHHGIARVGLVLDVQNHYHSSRGGGYYTADVSMSLIPPVDGRTTTVVHYPGQVSAPDGARYTILVDARDAGYAEFPGSPATKSWSWLLLLAFAIVVGGVDALFARQRLRLRRFRRSTNPR